VKRIVILTNSLSGGGAETSAQILQKELISSGLEVVLIGINSENPFAVTKTSNLFSLERDKSRPIRSTVSNLISFRRFLVTQRIDTLIVNCELPELFAIVAPRNIQLVIVEHANPSWLKRESLGWMVRKTLERRKPLLVTVGQHLRPRFFEGLSYTHIPNPLCSVSTKDIMPIASKIKRLVYVGRFSPLFKNPLLVLLIAEKVNLPVLMIGDGVLKNKLESYAMIHGIDCRFTGFKVNPWNLFESGDLMIIPSTAEGDGLTLIEAIQRNIPFLASNIPDLNRHGISLSNYCSDLRSFIDSINEFRYRLNELTVPNDLSRKILEDRRPDKVADRWIRLLSSSTN
jgi:hypothetical protein